MCHFITGTETDALGAIGFKAKEGAHGATV